MTDKNNSCAKIIKSIWSDLGYEIKYIKISKINMYLSTICKKVDVYDMHENLIVSLIVFSGVG